MIWHSTRFEWTEYTVPAKVTCMYRIAVLSDLHENPGWEKVVEMTSEKKPDLVLLPGDIVETNPAQRETGFRFLRAIADHFPAYYALGNHEYRFPDGEEPVDRIKNTGVNLLRNESARFGELNIGGMTGEFELDPETDAFLKAYEKEDGVKVLMCHEPERYFRYVNKYDVPVVLAGHAHGGQWRVFGHGVYAPGQGIFPPWTQGVHEGRLVISRGLGNHNCFPRLWNRPELVLLRLEPER